MIFSGFRSKNGSGDKLPMGSNSFSATPYNNLSPDRPLLVENQDVRPSTRLEKQETDKERITKVVSNTHNNEPEKVREQNTEKSESKEMDVEGNNQSEKERKFKEFKEKGNNFAEEVWSCLFLNKFMSFFFR